MIYEKPIPNSRALLPTFPRNCPDGSQFCPDGVSFCLEYHPQSLLFTQQSHPKTPPSPTQDTPFPGLNLKVGKMKFSLGNWTPSGRHVWKVVNTFLEVSKKKLFMKLSVKLCFGFYPTRQEPRLDLIAPAQPQVSCLRILGDSKPCQAGTGSGCVFDSGLLLLAGRPMNRLMTIEHGKRQTP